MSLLKDMLNDLAEEAAAGSTSAVGTGNTGGHEGVADVKDGKKRTKKRKDERKMKMIRRVVSEQQKFDTTDVISKLKAAEKAAEIDKDTILFGLEDDTGQIIKVYVRAEQARDFEDAVETALAGEVENETDVNTTPEIAKILYELKDRFDIVDIDWPTIPEDEEETNELEGGDNQDDDLGTEGGEGEDTEGADDLELDPDAEDIGGDEEAAKSALTQVIDMMKADAEAKKAEAEAKKAEAESVTAKYATQAAEEKVKQEEEILDMETYNKSKTDAQKEAKRLAQLAKYKHDVGAEEEPANEDISMENEEDSKTLSRQEATQSIFDLIMKQRAQG